MNLVVNGIEVRKNEDGMFSINDLHKSSGLGESKAPSKFLTGKGAGVKLVNFLNGEDSPFGKAVKSTRGRYNGGTWVCKELVYAYAMWISPKFNVTVIRAFDALVMGEFATALKIASNSAYINKAGDEFDRIINSDSAKGSEAMNDFANACGIYEKYASKSGCDLAACRGKPKKRSDAEKAIIERSQYTINLTI